MSANDSHRCDDDRMGWKEAGDAVLNRRVELGMRTRGEFADATGLTIKTLGELERGSRTNFDRTTLALIEQALRWPAGTIASLAESPDDPSPAAAPGLDDLPAEIAALLTRYTSAPDWLRAAILRRIAGLTDWATREQARETAGHPDLTAAEAIAAATDLTDDQRARMLRVLDLLDGDGMMRDRLVRARDGDLHPDDALTLAFIEAAERG